MNWVWIAGGVAVFFGILLLSEYLSTPAEVESEEKGAVSDESPREHERALFDDKKTTAEAEQAVDKEVDTWK